MTTERVCKHTCKPHCNHKPCKRIFDSDFDGDGIPDTASLFCSVCGILRWSYTCLTCSLDTMSKVMLYDDTFPIHKALYPSHQFMEPRLVDG